MPEGVGSTAMEEKGMRVMRLHRLHFNSIPFFRKIAMSCPQWHRASEGEGADGGNGFGCVVIC